MKFIALAAFAQAISWTAYDTQSYVGPKPGLHDDTDDAISKISKVRKVEPYVPPVKAYPWTPELLPDCPNPPRTILDD